MTKETFPNFEKRTHTNTIRREEKHMDLKEYTTPAETYLKAADIIANPTALFEIQSEGKFVMSERYGTERLHLLGSFNGKKYTWDCSKTNAQAIVKVLGEDGKKWIGKTVLFETYKNKNSEGKLVDVINVKQVK